MCKITILFADNDPDFLASYGEQLEQGGYRVLPAGNPQEAAEILENHHLHLAILDKRLENNRDTLDDSGIRLAQHHARDLPKLILTSYPEIEHVRAALRPDRHELPPAVNFLDKRELAEPGRLVAAVQEALDAHLPLNWEQDLYCQPPLSLAQLAALMDAGGTAGPVEEQLCELRDLFRRLFPKAVQVTLEGLVLDPETIVLKAYTHSARGPADHYLVACGSRALMQVEARCYQEQLPAAIQDGNLRQQGSAWTTHYGAIRYTVAGGAVDHLLRFDEFARRYGNEAALAVLDDLFGRQLRRWHDQGRYLDEKAGVTDFYRKRPGAAASLATLNTLIEALCTQIMAAGLGRCHDEPRWLHFHLSPGQAERYPHPAVFWSGDALPAGDEVDWGCVHGRVQAETIIAAPERQTWLVDFRSITQAPLLHDFATLENDLKLALPAGENLATLHTLESRLLAPDSWGGAVDPAGLDAETAAVLMQVVRIREWASRTAGCDFEAYLTALYYLAIEEVFRFNPQRRYTRRNLVPFAHALLFAGMAGQRLAQPGRATPASLPAEAKAALWLDEANQLLWVEGREVTLSQQEWAVVCYLYQRLGEVCTRQALVEEALGDPYDRYDREQTRLNSLMSRLRHALEPNPRKPKYLQTMRGRGYRLILPE